MVPQMAESVGIEKLVLDDVELTNTGTVKQRIIRHLIRLTPEVESISSYGTITYSACQDGIASAIGVSRAHAALELSRLSKEGIVDVKLAHIKGYHRRKKVYYLKGVFEYELR